MRRRSPLAAVAALAAMVVSVAALPTAARAPVDTLETGADGGAGAQPVRRSFDVVSVSQTTDITSDLNARVVAAAQQVGAVVMPSRGASVGMTGVWRGTNAVQLAPLGYQFPMGVTVLDPEVVAAMMGRDVSAPVAAGAVVMARTSAELRGAQPGDDLALVAADGSQVVVPIGLVAADDVVGGAELVVSPALADVLGVSRVTRLLVYGFGDRSAIEAGLADHGVVTTAMIAGQRTRVRRSWDSPDPDSTLGLVATKARLGEPAYRVSGNGVDVSLSPEWTNAYMPPDREWLFAYQGAPAHPAYTIRARCNNVIKADLVAALGEVHAAGLDAAIDFVNANTYGGCFYPRFNRVSGALGFLSRHSWGMALDVNTTTNAQGAMPQMDCRVVRIFRAHNFAWGGNFTSRDGMHFEWVGERRDHLQYPSTFCPNAPLGEPRSLDAVAPAVGDARSTLFAEDGMGPLGGE